MKFNELKTSEGRMHILLNIITVYAAVKGFLPASTVAYIAAGSTALYILSRSLVKAGETWASKTATTKDDEFIAKVKSVLDQINATVATPEAK